MDDLIGPRRPHLLRRMSARPRDRHLIDAGLRAAGNAGADSTSDRSSGSHVGRKSASGHALAVFHDATEFTDGSPAGVFDADVGGATVSPHIERRSQRSRIEVVEPHRRPDRARATDRQTESDAGPTNSADETRRRPVLAQHRLRAGPMGHPHAEHRHRFLVHHRAIRRRTRRLGGERVRHHGPGIRGG